MWTHSRGIFWINKITDLSSKMLEKEVALPLPFMVLLDQSDVSVISLMLECMLCAPYLTWSAQLNIQHIQTPEDRNHTNNLVPHIIDLYTILQYFLHSFYKSSSFYI